MGANRLSSSTSAGQVYAYDAAGRLTSAQDTRGSICNPRTGQTATRYGWLGGFDRSADTPGGVLLMGARLYVPSLSRFLQVDPAADNDVNGYDYAGQDPLAKLDLNGLKKKVWKKKWASSTPSPSTTTGARPRTFVTSRTRRRRSCRTSSGPCPSGG